MCWRTIVGFNETVELQLMVQGYNRNEFDSAFGHIKLKLKSTDVCTQADIINNISKSFGSTRSVPLAHVQWSVLKSLLENLQDTLEVFHL